MNETILKLAAERAVERAHFGNFTLTQSGYPEIVGKEFRVPVVVKYRDIAPDPIDLMKDEPSVQGVVVFDAESFHPATPPRVDADFTLLGTLAKEWDKAHSPGR